MKDDLELENLKKDLKAMLDEAEWSWLAKHSERDALIVVAPGLDLMEVAVRVARDEAQDIQLWIEAGRIGKPTAGQLAAWAAEPTKKFLSLVVQPYVLIQEWVH